MMPTITIKWVADAEPPVEVCISAPRADVYSWTFKLTPAEARLLADRLYSVAERENARKPR